MRPEKFGDSYDFVKRDIIHWLAPAGEWATHPMYFGPRPVAGFVDRHAEFLGIALAEGETTRRNLVSAVGRDCLRHLLLDPDTGLWAGQSNPPYNGYEHVTIEELADIANAPGRASRLTLVFDQSFSRVNDEERKRLTEEKLQTLRNDHEVHGVAYVSHAVFIWVSKDEDLLYNATRRLQERSRLPRCRFVCDGCEQHIGA